MSPLRRSLISSSSGGSRLRTKLLAFSSRLPAIWKGVFLAKRGTPLKWPLAVQPTPRTALTLDHHASERRIDGVLDEAGPLLSARKQSRAVIEDGQVLVG